MSKQENSTKINLIDLISNKTSFIFIKFEDFCSPSYPSEIGCARVQNDCIVATLHTFITPTNCTEMQSCIKSVQISQKTTGIPVPWSIEFQQCQPCVKYDQNLLQFGQLLIQFCTASSSVLKNGLGKDINVQIFSDFEQNNDYVFLVKMQKIETNIENKILSGMMGIKNKVVNVNDVLKKFFKLQLTFEHQYTNRKTNSCAFHKKFPNQSARLRKILHCALDLALYLAEKFVKQFYLVDEIQTKVIYQDDEIIIEW
ncbi:Conserved_hypothetical protein [Hexamita inflata]|uniref:Uncharacterized protein n=1 Tax=Hexamita inflata TaxID=28002 RepID=A0AA86V5E9_9EUKA|nr:Conserved hypothetical protein [Hexamita inflata]